ncbi:GRASP55/65 PDZ-like domain-containing protein [Phellopilus nigrolimitatus]|nr:GRASP55/65 PDZ-like domain-containing protein [Phellopilus nigrolimitatus]
MGAGQSVPDEGKPPTRGLHVLRVTPGSPASQTDIEPFFDFIVGYDDASRSPQMANIEAHGFEKVVVEHEGRRLDLIVWSSKGQTTRHVPIIPSREWSKPQQLEENTESKAATQPSLLGLSMRICDPEFSLDNVWHVLDVLEGSPAESAGLVPYGDWIVGWSGGVLASESDFYDVVEAHEDKPLRVYVYSFDFNTLREVVLVPNRQWGGEGLLGCVFGYGLLHRIPPVQEDSTLQHGQFYDEAEVFVPADKEEYKKHDYGFERDEFEAVPPSREQEASPSTSQADNVGQARLSLTSNGDTSSLHYLDPPSRSPLLPVS